MARRLATILFVAAIATSPISMYAESSTSVVHIAIVTDGPSDRAAPLRALFLEELRAVNRGEFDIQAPADLQIEGDRTLAGVRVVLDRVLADPRTDLVIALGVLASQAAAQRADLPKPVLAPFVASRGFRNCRIATAPAAKRT